MAEPQSLKERTAKGILWGGLSNGGMQVLNLLFGIFLARLLTRQEYGMVGVLGLFSALANIFLEGGFIAAIVNKKEARHEDYNALFWFNILGGIVVYGILFCCAPWIALFFKMPELTALSRFLFLGFVFSACGTAPSAYFLRHLMVKERAKITLLSMILSGLVGVYCAFSGWGYWSLAVQTVLFTGCTTLLLWFFSPWHPTCKLNFRPLVEMWPYSSKLFLTYIANQVNNNVFPVFIGRYYSMDQAGTYTQGNKWTIMGYSTLSGMIQGVAQPVLRESAQDQTARLRNVFRKMLRFTAFISFPLMLGLGLVAEELIVITITDKWLPSVAVMQLLCLWGAFVPLSTLYANLMNSIGRPAVYMWNTLALGALQLLCVWLSSPYGLHTMLVVFVTINIAWMFVWQYFAKKHIGLRLLDVLRDTVPYLFIAALVLAAAAWMAGHVNNLYASLGVKIFTAVTLYILIMWKLDSVIFAESVNYLFKRKKK